VSEGAQQGVQLGAFLAALTGLLAALLALAVHPVAATLLSLGAMALLVRAAAAFCGLSEDFRLNPSKQTKGEDTWQTTHQR
jgi:hypothetical protein